MKMYVVGMQKCLGEALLMSTHNIYFQGEKKNNKIITLYVLVEKNALSGAVIYIVSQEYKPLTNCLHAHVHPAKTQISLGICPV